MNLKYRPDIDGLRAVAVGAVVMYHAGLGSLDGGFVGVDVFFVISGYLITRLLVDQSNTEPMKETLRNFYARRAGRILPALTLLVLATVLVGAVLLLPIDLTSFGRSVASTGVFASNMVFMREADYFDTAAQFKPLLHTWSLAVEEQFYLLYPLPLLWARRRLGRWVWVPIALVCALSLFACTFATGVRPEAAFYLAPLRFWELGLGALAAVLPALYFANVWFANVVSLIGAGLIAFAAATFSIDTHFPGYLALIPCLGTVLLIVAVHERSIVHRLLSLSPMVFIGLISYSLYLWHWPILVFAKYMLIREPTIFERMLLVASSIFIAWLAWRYFERPLRNRAKQARPRNVLLASACTMTLTVVLGSVMWRSDGWRGRFPESITTISDVASEPSPLSGINCTAIDHPHLGNVSGKQVCILGTEGNAPYFVLWGDSHAQALVPAIHQLALQRSVSGILFGYGCPPLVGVNTYSQNMTSCANFADFVVDEIARRGAKSVILAARWAVYVEGTRFPPEMGPAVYLTPSGNVADNYEAFRSALIATLQRLRTLGVQVYLMNDVPEIGYDVPRALARKMLFASPVRIEPSTVEYLHRQGRVRNLFDEMSRARLVKVIDPFKNFCDELFCHVDSSGRPLYRDDDHVSELGAQLIANVLADAVSQQ